MITSKQKLLDYLKAHNFMSVATHEKHLWTAWVYYVIDDNFNLYFVSQPDTEHCKNILKNGEVACAIADSHQKVTAKKIGVQLYGNAYQLKNIQQLRWMLTLWNKVNPGMEKVINLRNMQKKIIKSRAFKVEPKKIKWYNEALYGEREFEEFIL